MKCVTELRKYASVTASNGNVVIDFHEDMDVEMTVIMPYVDEIKKKKPKVVEYIEGTESLAYKKSCDSLARNKGFMVYSEFECYGQQITQHSEVFIQRKDNGNWIAWRGTWRDGGGKPFSEKIIINDVDCRGAIKKACAYISNFKLFNEDQTA